jgi:hypothetical protein
LYGEHSQQQHPKSILKRSRTNSSSSAQQRNHYSSSNSNSNVPGVVLLHPADNMKSKVRFTPMLSVYSNIADLTEILQCCWYSKQELRNLKAERKTMIRLLKRVNFDASKIDTSIHGSLRGLEPYSSVSYGMSFCVIISFVVFEIYYLSLSLSLTHTYAQFCFPLLLPTD